jgi:hypothetical protein
MERYARDRQAHLVACAAPPPPPPQARVFTGPVPA